MIFFGIIWNFLGIIWNELGLAPGPAAWAAAQRADECLFALVGPREMAGISPAMTWRGLVHDVAEWAPGASRRRIGAAKLIRAGFVLLVVHASSSGTRRPREGQAYVNDIVALP